MFDWVTGLVEAGGYFGIALLMLAENVFPPMPSEVIMPLAGYVAARGELNIALVVLSGTIGSLAGAVFWYWVGRRVGRRRVKRWAARHGSWLTLSPEDVDKATDWFHRHGRRAVFTGRLVPVVRTLISLPAGTGRMPLPRFLVFTALGTALWTALLAAAGYLLESQYEKVADYLNPVSNVVFAGIVLYYFWRVWKCYHPSGKLEEDEDETGRETR